MASRRQFLFLSNIHIKHLTHKLSTLNNPNVSQDAKQHAQDQLKVRGADKFDYESQVPDEQQKNPNNVAGGLKA